jgi:hypothetical protein
MKPSLSGTLPLSPLLSDKAQSAFVLDSLKTGTLISLSQICDDNCTAIFDRSQVRILKENKIILTGPRTPNGLWSLPLIPPSSHQANGLLRLDQPKRALAQYYHASLGSPVPSTLLRAIRQGHLVSFPGLTTDLISKHLPKSYATVLGHQDQEARNQRSTSITFDNTPPPDDDLAPSLGATGASQSPHHCHAVPRGSTPQELFRSNRSVPCSLLKWQPLPVCPLQPGHQLHPRRRHSQPESRHTP